MFRRAFDEEYRGLAGADLDALIARQRDHSAALGLRVEWETYGHDEPADLPARLLAAGFVADQVGTVLIGRVDALAAEPVPPPGVTIREVTSEADFGRIAAMQGVVWGIDAGWLVPYRAGRFAALYGGSTLPAWQGRGIYRALVAERARLALERGYELLFVDASAQSRPILERLGLTPVATRTSYVWTP